ncbi:MULTISPECIES: DUF4350 domain-containing protein [Aphanizomenonaceae]|uniref:DUF4350 domain-containing protein n=1 Tax=Aphanizomenonaceae TaxID=1892259 RepID=UPI000488A5F4|nr:MULTISPECIES: DUF4350 domain-containing protein [Aphanizomenonaceae]MBE9258639.1 DUF4350 domain-containing protein [Dolichospermum sp. LEGE 00246]MDK2411609.1 DUF4350 domain-containing protein [Aphanizomenon sp. 202]MDK2462083.1 DUF4350 domain-containing protein [Aphanizomenon sp. PH219]QSV73613.1 MAG: DUF4350 domain-containing protein [Aphanizomenon flos-aquae KM1D3_PB]
MKRNQRVAWLGAIVLAVIILLTTIAAPNTQITSGSTYNRGPDGYGAWYAFMQDQDISIQRWQKPFSDLPTTKSPITLLQINSTLQEIEIYSEPEEWVKKGNNLVILGIKQPVTAAVFGTQQQSPFGNIKIDTRRRYHTSKAEQVILGDKFGAIIWQKKSGKGKVILVTTPYLAANAYQDNDSNFKLLADLVTKNSQKVFVDEYIHGYKDKDIQKKVGEDSIFNYFAKTPLLPAFIQLIVLLLALIWAENRRFGKPVNLETPVINNSQAYIQALAGVLHKAESTDFVVEMLGKEEQIQLQKALGLSQIPVDNQVLLKIWEEQTGNNTEKLNAVLQLQSQKRRISERELISWLEKWRNL